MISFEGIFLNLKGKNLFENFYLDIEKGEKIFISGPSGSGKTTIIRLLLGFMKPDSGKILFNDKILDRKTITEIRKEIFYLSQDIDFRSGKVSEVLEEIFTFDANRGLSFKTSETERFMEELKLDKDILDKEIDELSGGERQRTGILLGLILNRPVFLMDEPTSALDEGMKIKVAEILGESDKTILVISHDDVFIKNKNYKRINIK